MGQTLSEPVTAKTSACCRDSNYRVGSSCMQGWRIKMEDCHVHILSLPDDPGSAFFAVYDGHGGEIFYHYYKNHLLPKKIVTWESKINFSSLSGAAMSQHAGKHLHEYITKTNEYKEGKIVEAMQQGFLEMDRAMQTDATLMAEPAGTTVIAILIKDNILYCVRIFIHNIKSSGNSFCPREVTMWNFPKKNVFHLIFFFFFFVGKQCRPVVFPEISIPLDRLNTKGKCNELYDLQANAGDSRAVACVNHEVVPLSRDHKPILDDERRRIEAAGGWVQFNRVNGHLALSRALGDFRFKRNKFKSLEEQIVTGKQK